MNKKQYVTPQVTCSNISLLLLNIGSITMSDDKDADPDAGMLTKDSSIWDDEDE